MDFLGIFVYVAIGFLGVFVGLMTYNVLGEIAYLPYGNSDTKKHEDVTREWTGPRCYRVLKLLGATDFRNRDLPFVIWSCLGCLLFVSARYYSSSE